MMTREPFATLRTERRRRAAEKVINPMSIARKETQ